MRRIFQYIGILVIALLLSPDSSGQPAVVAFEGVSVIPMDRERVLTDQTVITVGDRIETMGAASSVRIPAGATRVDGRGRFLIPALAEMHVHFPPNDSPQTERMLFLLVANGVGTIRSMLGNPWHFSVRARVARGEIIAPTMYLAGPPFSKDTAASSDGLATRVAEQKSAGYDFVKIMEGVPRPSFDALVSGAKRVGIRVLGHVPADVGLQGVLDAKYWTIEHLDGYVEALARPGTPPAELDRAGSGGEGGANILAYVDESHIPELAAQTKAAGTWNVPTQMTFENRFSSAEPESIRTWPEMRYAEPAAIEDGVENKRRYIQAYSPQDRQHLIELRRKLVKALNDLGGGLLLGSDTPNRWSVPGFSTHRELALYVAAGLTPYQALATGTRNVAVHFGTLEKTGTVAAGKRADLVLLDANPLQDITNTTRIAGVMLGGRWMPKSEIDRRLALYRR